MQQSHYFFLSNSFLCSGDKIFRFILFDIIEVLFFDITEKKVLKQSIQMISDIYQSNFLVIDLGYDNVVDFYGRTKEIGIKYIKKEACFF